MRIQRTISVLLGVACLAGVAAPVSAQTYYAREILKGVARNATPPATNHTYSATYSSTYGTCTGGTQRAPITACTRSDGQDADLSMCGTQYLEKTCVSDTSCRALTTRTWLDGTVGGTTWSSSSAPSAAAAQAWCNSVKPVGYVGTCSWDSRDNRVTLSTIPTVFFNNPALYAATCR